MQFFEVRMRFIGGLFLLFITTLVAMAAAETQFHEANIIDFDDMEYEWQFSTPTPVISFDSIKVEFSHDNVEQVQMFLENIGTGQPYGFWTLVNGFGSGTGNRIGVTDGDLTDLVGLAELTFVETGASTTVRDFLADPVPTGEYLAEEWGNNFGTGSPPYEPTTWRLVIRDNTIAFSDMGAIGQLSVTYTTPNSIDGDFNDDGIYNCADVDALVADIAAGTNTIATYDLDGNGSVTNSDLDAWLTEAGSVNLASGSAFLPGDANLDGTVNGADFLVWNANKFTTTAAWCHGDFNADGAVNGEDFLIWNATKFTSSDVTAVPEPTVWLALLLAAAIPLRR
jgi:hypothetical protein